MIQRIEALSFCDCIKREDKDPKDLLGNAGESAAGKWAWFMISGFRKIVKKRSK